MTLLRARLGAVCRNRLIVGAGLAVLSLIALNLVLVFVGWIIMAAIAYPLAFLLAMVIGLALGCSRAVGPRAALAAGSLLTIAAFSWLLVIAALLPGGIDQGPVLVVIPLAVASAFVMITASLVRWVLASLKGHR